MIPYEHLTAVLFGQPVALLPQRAEIYSNILLSRISARAGGAASAADQPIVSVQAFPVIERADGSVEAHSPRAHRFLGEFMTDDGGRPSLYPITPDGTAIISIVGSLINRGAWIGASCGLISYEGLRHQIKTAENDQRVTATLLDWECPGGEVFGCFETAELVRRIATKKPVISLFNGMACSAAYAIASGSTRIYGIPSHISGSIGVYMLHIDIADYLAKEGVKPTFIFAGKHKVEGNEFEHLAEDVQKRFQAEVDYFHGMFISAVAAGRTNLTEDAIRATEAATYIGEQAKTVGLVDEIITADALISGLSDPKRRAGLLGGSGGNAVAQRRAALRDGVGGSRNDRMAAFGGSLAALMTENE